MARFPCTSHKVWFFSDPVSWLPAALLKAELALPIG